MDSNGQIAPTIRSIFRQKDCMADIPEDQDLFDYGVSSLAVIEIQILVEEALKVEVPTSDLMGHPTISDWISIYTREAAASGRASEVDTTNGSLES